MLKERFPSVQHGIQAEMIKHLLSCLLAYGFPYVNWSTHHSDHGFSQSGRLARGCKPASAAFDDHLARAGDIGSNCGQLAGCGFQQGHWQALPAGREHESVGGLHPGAHIGFNA